MLIGKSSLPLHFIYEKDFIIINIIMTLLENCFTGVLPALYCALGLKE